jgi:riboflavin synthase
MFTGLIADVGMIDAISSGQGGRELRIRSAFDSLADGESVAVNGACLTVRERGTGWFTVGAVETTLGRTTIGDWKVGRRVNLERALAIGDRLGGHMVSGHVDGVAKVISVDQAGDTRLIALAVPDMVMELSVLHGSITVDGVSLTVNALPADGTVQLSLIEYTLRHTTLGELKPGDAVHVEADMIGKYVQRLVQPFTRLSSCALRFRSE